MARSWASLVSKFLSARSVSIEKFADYDELRGEFPLRANRWNGKSR